jgi:hypothetical protein
MAGFEPKSSVPQADAMTTAPDRRKTCKISIYNLLKLGRFKDNQK